MRAPSQEALVMTELAENPQDSFDPRLDAPVFGAVNWVATLTPSFFRG